MEKRRIRSCDYTEEQLDYLREITPGRWNKEITKMFNNKFNQNRTETAIMGVRQRNGIKTGFNGAFPKGSTPWNKGKRGLMGANSTSFKKGEKPPNWVPIGTERVTRDGYPEIKIQDGKGQKNWRGKHIVTWEKENGPLPKDHVIIFGDGDKANIDIDNLICVSRKQLLGLNRHDLIQEDAELTRTAVNIVDLNYKISELSKEG